MDVSKIKDLTEGTAVTFFDFETVRIDLSRESLWSSRDGGDKFLDAVDFEPN